MIAIIGKKKYEVFLRKTKYLNNGSLALIVVAKNAILS